MTEASTTIKVFSKAGAEITPELCSDKIVIYMFGKGKGYVADPSGVHNICEEASFYFPNFHKNRYRIHAFEDMEFIKSVVVMDDYDWRITAIPMYGRQISVGSVNVPVDDQGLQGSPYASVCII